MLLLAALLGSGRAAHAHVPAHGDLDVLVVLASFPDRPLTRPRADLEALLARFVAYWTEVSYGQLRLRPHLATVTVTVPQLRQRYVQRPAELATDALRAFAAAAGGSDRAALERGGAALVIFAGTGRESHLGGGDPGDPWSNYTGLLEPVAGFDEACVLAEDEAPPFGRLGVMAHEFGHLLGLPELYAPGGRPQEGIGVWGLMGQGTWVGRGDWPPHPEAWSKRHLGWVATWDVTTSTTGIVLPAVETVPLVVRIPLAPERPSEYLLLENRQRIGADAKLPGAGLLVWHVDEGVTGFRTAQNDVRRKLLHLVEADARGDLDRGHAAGGNRGDAGDPWSGPPAWRRILAAVLAAVAVLLVAMAVRRLGRPGWPLALLVGVGVAGAALAGAARLRQGPICGPETPGMTPYGGGPGRVMLRNFSASGPVMRFDVEIAGAAAPE
ncbi:MAG: M6 family metalloprotease domain-containing protein [bacterium]|nr:M6 family metalloprotease domain-containing protein [bacterium]